MDGNDWLHHHSIWNKVKIRPLMDGNHKPPLLIINGLVKIRPLRMETELSPMLLLSAFQVKIRPLMDGNLELLNYKL